MQDCKSAAMIGSSSAMRIFGLFMSGQYRLRCRQAELEGRAAAWLAVRPDAASMFFDNDLDDGQADTVAREVTLRMQTLEESEEFARMPVVKSSAIVFDPKHVFVPLGARAAFHERVL